MDAVVKEELFDSSSAPEPPKNNSVLKKRVAVINLSSSSSSSDSDSDDSDDADVNGVIAEVLGNYGKRDRVSSSTEGGSSKKMRSDDFGAALPVGFLKPLPPEKVSPVVVEPLFALPAQDNAVARRQSTANLSVNVNTQSSKQFWRAGEYDGAPTGDWESASGGMDHVRVHPKFLHSNATSHKWALGAFAELLDNSLDEICNGAKYVHIDMLENRKDGSRMVSIEDNGGGMDPDKLRQCMSLGYSVKSKVAKTIGQYGNGFKTSTMRLGADVIVFSRCSGKDGRSPTQSIGLLSYTFLSSTGKEDIVVPMLDYKREHGQWTKMTRVSSGDWNRNVETIVQWSPFSSEADLLRQFNLMTNRGTRIIIYNLWEDDHGLKELDFDADPHDIQLRGVNRDEKNIKMAKTYPTSRVFLTYRFSLRSYASILYLRLPPAFRIIIRGRDVEHHNLVNDMMRSQEVMYRPQTVADVVVKDLDMTAVVTIGFVKDARYHIDVQGFNVYHKNRLIKPFWRLWNPAGSDGRGVIGVLEANFVEPAHDKQGFERTTVLARLEARLIQMQKAYWSSLCHTIGYAPRHSKKHINDSEDSESSADYEPKTSLSKKKCAASTSKTQRSVSGKGVKVHGNRQFSSELKKRKKNPSKSGKAQRSSEPSSASAEYASDNYMQNTQPERHANGGVHKNSSGKDGQRGTMSSSYLDDTESRQNSGARRVRDVTQAQSKGYTINGKNHSLSNADVNTLGQLKEENDKLKQRLEKEGSILGQLHKDLQCERDRCKSLEMKLEEAERKIEVLNKEQENLIDIFSEERDRRDTAEENLRKKLKDASDTMQDLLEKVRLLERMKCPKPENSRY